MNLQTHTVLTRSIFEDEYYDGVKCWNTLDIGIKHSLSPNSLKKNLFFLLNAMRTVDFVFKINKNVIASSKLCAQPPSHTLNSYVHTIYLYTLFFSSAMRLNLWNSPHLPFAHAREIC